MEGCLAPCAPPTPGPSFDAAPLQRASPPTPVLLTCALASYRSQTAVMVVPASARMLRMRKWRKLGKNTNSCRMAPQMICRSLCEQV